MVNATHLECVGFGLRGSSPLAPIEIDGGGGIRTHGILRFAGFQDRSHQPLDHPSRGLLQIKCSSVLAGCRAMTPLA